jgi:ATP phosphoribosyltransferase
VIPKGGLNKKVLDLLNDVGVGIEADGRCYIPGVEHPQIAVKIMKPQNIPQLVELGFHDIGFTGLDWIQETGASVEYLLDLGFDPVSIVPAVPVNISRKELFKKKIVVASEYESVAREYLDRVGDFTL